MNEAADEASDVCVVIWDALQAMYAIVLAEEALRATRENTTRPTRSKRTTNETEYTEECKKDVSDIVKDMFVSCNSDRRWFVYLQEGRRETAAVLVEYITRRDLSRPSLGV